MAIYDFDNIVRTKDITHYVTGGNGSMGGLYNAFNQYANTDYILFTKNTNYPNYLPITYSDGIVSSEYCPDSSYGYIVLPFQSLQNLFKIEFDLKVDAQYSANSYGIFLVRADTNGSSNRITLYEAYPAPQMSDFQHFEIDISNQDVEYGYIAITYSYSNKSTIKNIKFYTIDVSPSGGAGSGYIGNSLLSNKKMVGYNVPTSSAESTKTESIEDASESPVSGKPKIGNGHARIKLIREYPTPPSNYLVDIEAEYGAFNLVTQNPLDTSRLTGVAVQGDYFYREDLVGSTVESGFLASFGGKFNITGKLIFETEVLIGDEDKNATANPDWVMGLYSDFSYSTRIIEMVYRNHNFQGQSYGDYFYYYSNTPLGYPLAPLDDADYYNTFTKIKFEMTLNNGVITGLKCYRDNTLYRDDSLNIDISSITMPYIKMSIPSAANKQPVTQKIKYFKVYTET